MRSQRLPTNVRVDDLELAAAVEDRASAAALDAVAGGVAVGEGEVLDDELREGLVVAVVGGPDLLRVAGVLVEDPTLALPLSVTSPPPSITTRASAACSLRPSPSRVIVITTGAGPQSKVITPPLADRARPPCATYSSTACRCRSRGRGGWCRPRGPPSAPARASPRVRRVVPSGRGVDGGRVGRHGDRHRDRGEGGGARPWRGGAEAAHPPTIGIRPGPRHAGAGPPAARAGPHQPALVGVPGAALGQRQLEHVAPSLGAGSCARPATGRCAGCRRGSGRRRRTGR